MFQRSSLRFRIFVSMILLVVLAFLVVVFVTINQFHKRSQEYQRLRILYKEEQIKTQIGYVLSQSYYPSETRFLPFIFRDEIFHIANSQNVNINLYDLQGNILVSSSGFFDDFSAVCLTDSILTYLESSLDKRLVKHEFHDKKEFQNLYSYIDNQQFKPIAILNIPHFENDNFHATTLRNTLYNLTIVYCFWLFVAIAVAYFLSGYITNNLKKIEKKLTKTQLLENNEKLSAKEAPSELAQLITAYNKMVDELEKNKIQLAKNEREMAWREMAKQIAHEIKNPLTPMRLTIQNFQRKFNPNAINIEEKVSEFSQSLLQHIDTLTEITSAFSSFTSLPDQQRSFTDITAVVRGVVDIFQQKNIIFRMEEEVNAYVDKNEINRVVTNLLKNAIQATELQPKPRVEIRLSHTEMDFTLQIEDNGIGIPKTMQEKIFEPKFTTKTTGSGLGLAIVANIVKSYQGQVSFTSEEGKGATFTIIIPKNTFT